MSLLIATAMTVVKQKRSSMRMAARSFEDLRFTLLGAQVVDQANTLLQRLVCLKGYKSTT